MKDATDSMVCCKVGGTALWKVALAVAATVGTSAAGGYWAGKKKK